MYDWSNPASPPGGTAPKLPPGRHEVRIARVMHENKEGNAFATRDDDPAMCVIFEDAQGREAMEFVATVDDSEKSWALRAMFQAFNPPANLEKMAAAGVTPSRFADHAFAEKQLVGRRLVVDVTHNTARNGKTYINLAYLPSGTPVNAAPKQAAGAGAKAEPHIEEDIPF